MTKLFLVLRRHVRVAVIALLLVGIGTPAAAVCSKRFINPITDICWSCMFPISVGAITIGGGLPDTKNQAFPFCLCAGIPPRVGLSVGLWEPARLVDVANEAGCFVNLGLELDMGLFAKGMSIDRQGAGQSSGSQWHAHYYYFPLVSMLGTIVDGLCLEHGGFDVAYMSEFDPLWQDADLNMLVNPEAVLFASPLAIAACAADCIAATTGLPLDSMFWCAGCQGSTYPMAGDVQAHDGGIQASSVITSRLIMRMHRLGLAPDTASETAQCVNRPGFIPQKSAYRFQLTRPRSITSRSRVLPFGRTTRIMELGAEYPVKGESFGWLVWRKRNCCAL